ncbi:hypothetical protein Tco_0977906 [Tanacetum coccineum]|uniref:Uncharacterized protein n=1 Tax=Tanacetum coccineum TaxID=301880 RepID=A0ABQ5ELM7_9ASTR
MGRNESDFHVDDQKILEVEPDVDMNGFHFKVDEHIDKIRTDDEKNFQECSVYVINFDGLYCGEESDNKQQFNRKRILKQIRKECKGSGNIRDGRFYVGQEFGRRKHVTEGFRLLFVES